MYPNPTVFTCVCVCRFKVANGELEQITSDTVLRTAIGNLEDGFRLTLWAYEKSEVRLDPALSQFIFPTLCVLQSQRALIHLLSAQSAPLNQFLAEERP